VWHAERWCPLAPIVDAARARGRSVSPALAAGVTDLIALLAGGSELSAEVAAAADAVAVDSLPEARPAPGLPFRPVTRRGDDGGMGGMGASVASFVGDGDVLPWPAHTNALDYQLELGLVVASPVRDLAPGGVLAAIGGVVLVNRVIARDVQRRATAAAESIGAGPADVAIAIGPVVVTADEILPVIDKLSVSVRVNGAACSARPATLRSPLSEVLSSAALAATLLPGQVIATGPVSGCSGAEAGRWLAPGDVVELAADHLGTLSNTVGEPAPWLRPGELDRPPWRSVPRRGMLPDPVRRLDPERARPAPPPPLTGVWAADRALDAVERWECPGGATPEDVLVDRAGRLHTGVRDGRIHRWPTHYPAAGGNPEVFADTHGRPTGLGLDPDDGTLLVCDAERGLLRVDARGRTRVLADEFGGAPLRFANNLAVASDGTVFFSDSSTRFGPANWRLDLLERRPSGRVFAYSTRGPGSRGALELLADRLYFPNGVALAPDGTYLLVAETSATRVSRLWLAGARGGQQEVVLDNLPAYPDNLSEAGDGTYWMALPSLRLPQVDRLMPYPGLRRVAARLPDRLQPRPSAYGLVALIDGDGGVLRTLHGPAGRYREITGVRQHGEWLYLGSLVETAVARVRLP
jgi:sugar lactone lactonase YvrE